MATYNPTVAQDGTTGEEVASTTVPPQQHGTPTKRNAFSDLMSPPKKLKPSDHKLNKSPPSSTPITDPARNTTFLGRDGLGAYITSPSSFPVSRVIYHDEKWVVINDLFPKSSIHLLLLPRDPSKQLLHPFDAFEDLDFLRDVQAKVKELKGLVAKELQRRFGKYSAQEQAHQRALQAIETSPPPSQPPPPTPTSPFPPARNYLPSTISGIHAGPSMNHLHIHVLSIDRHSESLKHRKHYNSFSTPVFIPVEDFPIGKGDERRRAAKVGWLESELVCWRCGRGFGNRFKKLKEHLGEEFLGWRGE